MNTKIKICKNDFVVVLTGAGISAESGIKTFRDNNGLWEDHSVEEVATPEGFFKNPALVWRFYKQRYYQLADVIPNSGHFALVKLEEYLADNFLLITQNVDGLHRQAGNKRIYEMHGSLEETYCLKCKTHYPTNTINLAQDIPKCKKCNASLRPDIVWFGEMPYFLPEIDLALRKATHFITIGTSGVVYPAAQFLMLAKMNGAKTIGVNFNSPDNRNFIEEFHQGKSGELLPKLVEQWISQEV